LQTGRFILNNSIYRELGTIFLNLDQLPLCTLNGHNHELPKPVFTASVKNIPQTKVSRKSMMFQATFIFFSLLAAAQTSAVLTGSGQPSRKTVSDICKCVELILSDLEKHDLGSLS
jgi:hypothetical protein